MRRPVLRITMGRMMIAVGLASALFFVVVRVHRGDVFLLYLVGSAVISTPLWMPLVYCLVSLSVACRIAKWGALTAAFVTVLVATMLVNGGPLEADQTLMVVSSWWMASWLVAGFAVKAWHVTRGSTLRPQPALA